MSNKDACMKLLQAFWAGEMDSKKLCQESAFLARTPLVKVQGPVDSYDGKTSLYWSEKDGWVDFSSADTFLRSDLGPYFHVETVGLVIVDTRGRNSRIIGFIPIKKEEFCYVKRTEVPGMQGKRV